MAPRTFKCDRGADGAHGTSGRSRPVQPPGGTGRALEAIHAGRRRSLFFAYLGPGEPPLPASDSIASASELRSIHRAVASDSPPEYTIPKARRDQQLSIAIAECARLKRPLRPDQLSGETRWERQRHEALRKQWGADPFKDAANVSQ